MSNSRLFCVVLLDMASLLWRGSSACMHAVAEERIRVDVSLCLTGCFAALAQQIQFTSFSSAYWRVKIQFNRLQIIC